MQNSLPSTNHAATFFIEPPSELSLDTPDNQFKHNFECTALYSFVFLEDIFFLKVRKVKNMHLQHCRSNCTSPNFVFFWQRTWKVKLISLFPCSFQYKQFFYFFIIETGVIKRYIMSIFLRMLKYSRCRHIKNSIQYLCNVWKPQKNWESIYVWTQFVNVPKLLLFCYS